ncbi:serine hydrolase domain-containing protein [Sphingomonas japonica]|nr:serine hydrolase [Sphingomonas japonica]
MLGGTTVVPPPSTDPLFAAGQGETRGVLMLIDGRVAQKRYAPGYSDANRFISWSMAKTITAMLVGELVADGRLQLDAPAPVAEWADDARRRITLRQLLHMASGLDHTEVGEPIENSDTNQILFVGGTQDMAARAIAKPLEAAPGQRFEYSSMTTLILSEIITRTLTDSREPRVRAAAYRRFAEERLLRPAGITTAFLEFDGAGTQIGGSILHMGLDDWGRIGTLLLDGRAADGTQVIAPGWLAFMKAPSPTNGHYGGQTWLNTAGADDALFPGKGPDTTVAALGHLGQYVIAARGTVPGTATPRSVVLVRLGKTQDDQLAAVRAALGDVLDPLVE